MSDRTVAATNHRSAIAALSAITAVSAITAL
jgi:hypothetical protein